MMRKDKNEEVCSVPLGFSKRSAMKRKLPTNRLRMWQCAGRPPQMLGGIIILLAVEKGLP